MIHSRSLLRVPCSAPRDSYVSRAIVNSKERPEWTVCASGSPPRVVSRSLRTYRFRLDVPTGAFAVATDGRHLASDDRPRA